MDLFRLTHEDLMKAWDKEYRRVNHKEPPPISYNNGWFHLRYRGYPAVKWRRRKLEVALDNLRTRPTKDNPNGK